MVIDFHTHIFPDAIAARSIELLSNASGIQAATDGTLNGLLASMDKAGVDMSVILPVVTKPSQFESVNTFAKEVNDRYKGRLLSFGGIHPDCQDYKAELEKIKDLGLPGIKLHPDYQKVMIDDIRYRNIIRYADELGLIIVVHAGVDIGLPDPVHCPPDRVRRIIEDIRPCKLVLAHMGGWKQWEAVYDCLAGEKVWLDTAFTFAYIEPDMFRKLLKKHDPDKILFATDSPWSDAMKDIQALKGLVGDPELAEDLLWRNAQRLLEM